MLTPAFQCRPATPEEQAYTVARLKEHTEQATGLDVSFEPFGLFAYEGEKLIGSVVGKIYFRWLHIDLIWVEDTRRGEGLGKKLMQFAETQATMRGLTGIEAWTQSWQAPEFYRKLGYEEFAVIDDFTPGRKRHAFRKVFP